MNVWIIKKGDLGKVVIKQQSRYLFVVITYFKDGKVDTSPQMPLVDANKEAKLMVKLLTEE